FPPKWKLFARYKRPCAAPRVAGNPPLRPLGGASPWLHQKLQGSATRLFGSGSGRLGLDTAESEPHSAAAGFEALRVRVPPLVGAFLAAAARPIFRPRPIRFASDDRFSA